MNNPKDANGIELHEGDRVFSYDYGGHEDGIERFDGTLSISDHPATNGKWCIDYDDGESFVVLDWKGIFKAINKP